MPKKKTAQALELYTALFQQISALKDEHEHVFVQLADLEDKLGVAEEALKQVVRESGENVENKHFTVRASESFKKWFDFATLKSLVNQDEWNEIEAKALKSVDIDPKAMTELVMEGKVRPEIVSQSYREKQMTTRVSIGRITQ